MLLRRRQVRPGVGAVDGSGLVDCGSGVVIVGYLEIRLDFVQLQISFAALELAGRVLDVEERRGLALVVAEVGLGRREPAHDPALAVGRAVFVGSDNLAADERVALRLPLVRVEVAAKFGDGLLAGRQIFRGLLELGEPIERALPGADRPRRQARDRPRLVEVLFLVACVGTTSRRWWGALNLISALRCARSNHVGQGLGFQRLDGKRGVLRAVGDARLKVRQARPRVRVVAGPVLYTDVLRSP